MKTATHSTGHRPPQGTVTVTVVVVVVAVTTAAKANYSSLIIENLVEIMEIDSHVNQHNVQQH